MVQQCEAGEYYKKCRRAKATSASSPPATSRTRSSRPQIDERQESHINDEGNDQDIKATIRVSHDKSRPADHDGDDGAMTSK